MMINKIVGTDGNGLGTFVNGRLVELLTTREAARYLAVRPVTIRQFASRGKLHIFGKLGQLNLYTKADLDECEQRLNHRWAIRPGMTLPES